ncbi:MAG: Rrf2 family transcriptional regulator [bacterium]|nr:Rrf2 family transcriptional regulator [bacterium]
MLTLTSKYALRALIYLVEHAEDWPIPGRQIAEQTGIPRKYLSKILGDLTRTGLLRSSPGRTGGFQLSHPPGKTRLLDVLTPFEQFDREQCPFHEQACGREEPCLAHAEWAKIVADKRRFLERTSIQDVVTKAQHPRRKRAARRKP